MIRAHGYVLVAAVLVGAAVISTNACAADEDVTNFDRWSARGSFEGGDDASRAGMVSIDFDGTGADGSAGSKFGISGFRTSASDTEGNVVSDSAQAYVKFGSSRVDAGISFDETREEDLRRSIRWTGLFDVSLSDWRLALKASVRNTDFDTFASSVPSTGPRGQPLTTVTTATCSIRDVGYGGTLSYSTDHWDGYAGGSSYNYDDATCDFGVSVPGAARHFDRNNFQQLSGSFVDRAESRSMGRIGQSSRLLENELGAGVSYTADRWATAFDYSHATDAFDGATDDNFSLTQTFRIRPRFSLDLTAGVTLSDTDNSPYIGLAMSSTW
jgi:hypothetical protein